MSSTVAITGAASGIGQASAPRLPRQGWAAFGLDAARDRLDATAARFAACQDRFNGTQAAFVPAGFR
jgi:NADP-dependent 3-hydroxy acid dehydrogenase YdfG